MAEGSGRILKAAQLYPFNGEVHEIVECRARIVTGAKTEVQDVR